MKAPDNIWIRTLGEQMTIYNEKGEIIKQIPDPSENPVTITYFNIVEYEDRLMGIDPDAKPDFFVDFDTDERFFDVSKDPRYNKSKKMRNLFSAVTVVCTLIISSILIAFSYAVN